LIEQNKTRELTTNNEERKHVPDQNNTFCFGIMLNESRIAVTHGT